MKAKEAIKTLDDFQCDIDYAAEFRGPLSFAIDEAKDALEKQVPKKPSIDNLGTSYSFWHRCPKCNRKLINNIDGSFVAGMKYKFCPDCGQKLDWSD